MITGYHRGDHSAILRFERNQVIGYSKHHCTLSPVSYIVNLFPKIFFFHNGIKRSSNFLR